MSDATPAATPPSTSPLLNRGAICSRMIRPGYEIGQLSFEAASHFDPDFPLLPGNQEDDTVVRTFLPDTPRLGDPDRKVFQGIPPQGGDSQHDDLGGVAPLKIGEFTLQVLDSCRREHPGIVIDAAAKLRDVEGKGRRCQKYQNYYEQRY